jgi:RHS repeat-associated protein
VYVYGVDGQKIGTYTFTLGQYGQTNTPEMTNSVMLLATFFGGKRVGVFDRLGSAKYNPDGATQSFYPYGEDRGTVQPNDSLKFATYTRDAATGLDYADQRYYASSYGRFNTADQYQGSGRPSDPVPRAIEGPQDALRFYLMMLCPEHDLLRQNHQATVADFRAAIRDGTSPDSLCVVETAHMSRTMPSPDSYRV